MTPKLEGSDSRGVCAFVDERMPTSSPLSQVVLSSFLHTWLSCIDVCI